MTVSARVLGWYPLACPVVFGRVQAVAMAVRHAKAAAVRQIDVRTDRKRYNHETVV